MNQRDDPPGEGGQIPRVPVSRPPQPSRPAPRVPVRTNPVAPGLEGGFAKDSVISDGVQGIDPVDSSANPAVTGEESPELAQVRLLAGTLAKAVKASQLYPADNPMCRKFVEDFQARLTETFQILDVVRLSVGKTKLFFAGETVLEQPGRDESVPGRLFWAGVREIAFHMGLTTEEAARFLGIFRTVAVEENPEQSDIVTLLWDARFEHLTYMAIDDILDLENESDPIPEEFGKDFMNFVDLEMHDLDDDDEMDRKANEMAEQIRSKFNDEDVALFGVSPEERAALAAEIQEEESPRMLRDIVHMIGETLLLERNEDSFEELVQILSGTMVALLNEGRLAEAREVIRMLNEVRLGVADPTPAMRTAIDRGVAAGYDRSRREVLIRHLDGGKRSVLEALDGFVRLLPNEAMEAMCDVLGNLQTVPARRRLTAALSLRANEDIRPFLPFLLDERSQLVTRVARILGNTGNERALEPLSGLLRHRDPSVRKHAVEAMGKVGSGRSIEPIFHAVTDPDPRVRIAAVRNLGSFGRSTLTGLLTLVQAEDFELRELPEKRAFYEALGAAGGQELLPMMRKTLQRKTLLRRTQNDELRACACEALGWIGGPEAEALLRSALEDRASLVRAAAQSALRRIAGGDARSESRKAAA